MVYRPSLLRWIIRKKNEETEKKWFETHGIEDPERFLMKLQVMENCADREAYLKENHTVLFIEALKATERDDELQEFYKGLRDNYEYYTFYIVLYLLPWFESLRRDGRLKKGKTAHFN